MENISANNNYCYECGSETGGDADFCPFCGVPQVKRPESSGSLESSTPEAEAPDPVAPEEANASEIENGDPGDDEEQTLLYTPDEFERLTTGEVKAEEVSGLEQAPEISSESIEETASEETEEAQPEETATEDEVSQEGDPEEVSAEEIGPEEALSEDAPALVEEVAPEEVAAEEVAAEPAADEPVQAEEEDQTENQPEIAAEVSPEVSADTADMGDAIDSSETPVEAVEETQEQAVEESHEEVVEEPGEDADDEPATLVDEFPSNPVSDPIDPTDSTNSTDSIDSTDSTDSIDSTDSSVEDVPDDVPPAPEFLSVLAAETPEAAAPEVVEEKGVTGEELTGTSQIETPDNTGGKKVNKHSQVLTEGTLLYGRYEIVRKIGGGGMGAVYLATDRNLGGVLRAVKEMVQSHIEAEQQEKALADFKRESLLLTSLEHPCIPTIYDYFYDESAARFYLVMKYISGGDLAARLRSAPEGRVDEKSVTEWAAQTADVLDYLHSRRPPIVYRDLKPSNLMIDGNTGRIMLIDFGIARWVTKDEKGVTAVGTMGYAPPELFSGNVEPRSDIYSLGATMFHLLTGADPQSNPLLIFDFSKHPRPRQVNPAISNEMEQILMRTVEYNVELRYTSAGELREALIAHLDRIRYGQLSYHQTHQSQPNAAVSASPPSQAGAGQNLVFCGFCGEKIIANDVFCPYCGAKQAVADQRPVHFVPQTRVLARVSVLGTGSLDPPTYNLEKESNIVGRRDPQTNIFPEVDLSKFDPQTKISRRHARIWKEGETFMVEDLGSSNGTVVVSSMNEAFKLSPHQPQVITHGTKLVLGDTTLHFIVG